MAQANPGGVTDALKVQHGPNGVDYISGGAGEEGRAAMAARQGEFPLKIVLSGNSGEYLVADRLSLSTPQGEVLTVRDAGPVLMVKLPPGQYTVEATSQGKTDRRPVHVETSAQTLNWRFRG